jgi:O-antigen/teichoic acid export membrane protein
MTSTRTEPATLVGVAARGGLWLAVTLILTRTSGFVISVALARLIVPAQFGLLGMANVALTAIAMVSELGLGAALVQRPQGRDFEATASTAFWTNVAFGWLLVGINAACAPLVASFFGDPSVTPVLRVMGLQLGTNSLGAVHHALLAREMDYRRKLLPDTLPGMVNGAVAIFAACHGWGVWSLVAGAQVGAVIGVFVVWRACRWRPQRLWDRGMAATLLRFGRHVIGAEFLRFVTQNVDYLVVGRLFGPGALGVYTMAFNLANLVVTNVGFLFARVAFPLFSRMQDDPARLRETFLRMEGYLVLISLPLMTLLCLLGREFIQVIYGPRWASAVGPLQVLTLLGAVRALSMLSSDTARALGRPDILSRVGLLATPLTVAGTLAGASYGLTGIAAGETAAAVVTGLVLIRAAMGLLGIETHELMERLAPIARATSLTALALLGTVTLLAASGTPPAVRLVAGALTGLAVFWIALGVERGPLLSEARRGLRRAATRPAVEGAGDVA